MKMKKIAAALLALSVLSGCSGNTATEETIATTVTTAEAETTVLTTTTAADSTTTVIETSKPQIVPPGSMLEAREDDLTKPPELTTIEEITAESIESNVIVDEVVEHIELKTYSRLTDYTELYCLALLFTHIGVPTMDLDMSAYFYKNYGEDPNISFIKDWGCYSVAIINTFRNSDSVFKDSFINLTNSSPETLYEYIDNDTPVMVWVTEGLAEPVLFAEYEGNKMYNPKECVVLAGYTDTAVCVWSVIEEKYVTYDRTLFEQRYAEMGSMALTLIKE